MKLFKNLKSGKCSCSTFELEKDENEVNDGKELKDKNLDCNDSVSQDCDTSGNSNSCCC